MGKRHWRDIPKYSADDPSMKTFKSETEYREWYQGQLESFDFDVAAWKQVHKALGSPRPDAFESWLGGIQDRFHEWADWQGHDHTFHMFVGFLYYHSGLFDRNGPPPRGRTPRFMKLEILCQRLDEELEPRAPGFTDEQAKVIAAELRAFAESE